MLHQPLQAHPHLRKRMNSQNAQGSLHKLRHVQSHDATSRQLMVTITVVTVTCLCTENLCESVANCTHLPQLPHQQPQLQLVQRQQCLELMTGEGKSTSEAAVQSACHPDPEAGLATNARLSNLGAKAPTAHQSMLAARTHATYVMQDDIWSPIASVAVAQGLPCWYNLNTFERHFGVVYNDQHISEEATVRAFCTFHRNRSESQLIVMMLTMQGYGQGLLQMHTQLPWVKSTKADMAHLQSHHTAAVMLIFGWQLLNSSFQTFHSGSIMYLHTKVPALAQLLSFPQSCMSVSKPTRCTCNVLLAKMNLPQLAR